MKKRGIALILAVVFVATIFGGCAKKKQSIANNLKQSLINLIVASPLTAKVSGLMQNGESIINVTDADFMFNYAKGGYEYSFKAKDTPEKSGSINMGINLAEPQFIDYLYNIAPQIGGNKNAISVISTSTQYQLNIQLTNFKDFLQNMLTCFISNLDKPFKNVINNFFKLSGSTYDISNFYTAVINAENNTTVANGLKLLDDALVGSGLNIEGLINTLINPSRFVDQDGYILDGVTLDDSAYKTIITSFGRMNFDIVMQMLLGQRLSKLLELFATGNTDEVLKFYLGESYHSVINNMVFVKNLISCNVVSGSVSAVFYADKNNYNISAFDIGIDIELKWLLSGQEFAQFAPLNINVKQNLKFTNVVIK